MIGHPPSPRRAWLWRAKITSTPVSDKSSHGQPRRAKMRCERLAVDFLSDTTPAKCAAKGARRRRRTRGARGRVSRTANVRSLAKRQERGREPSKRVEIEPTSRGRVRVARVSTRASSPPVPRRRPRAGEASRREGEDCASTRPTPDSSARRIQSATRERLSGTSGEAAEEAGRAGVAGATRGRRHAEVGATAGQKSEARRRAGCLGSRVDGARNQRLRRRARGARPPLSSGDVSKASSSTSA